MQVLARTPSDYRSPAVTRFARERGKIAPAHTVITAAPRQQPVFPVISAFLLRVQFSGGALTRRNPPGSLGRNISARKRVGVRGRASRGEPEPLRERSVKEGSPWKEGNS